MSTPADIKDPVFRSAVEEADRLLDEGDYTGASRKCAETYLLLLDKHPELIPPKPAALGVVSTGSFASYLRSPTPTWPRTGGLNVVTGDDGKPHLTYDKERFSFSEAAGYYEFLISELRRLQD
jgi:hypothetical protein